MGKKNLAHTASQTLQSGRGLASQCERCHRPAEVIYQQSPKRETKATEITDFFYQ